jgi:biotin operon repressor
MKKGEMDVWKALSDNRGEWISLNKLCFSTGMSRRQLASRVAKMGLKYVTSEVDNKDIYYRLDCSLDEATDEAVRLLAAFYRCKKEDVRHVIDSISIAGTMTLDELAVGTPFTVRNVAYILYMTPCIVMTKYGSRNRYYKVMDDVPVYI